MNPVEIIRGNSPILLTMPHTGLFIPGKIQQNLNKAGLMLTDTDWHIDKLYKDLLPNATIVRANFHRYVIDANRHPSGKSLYPGQNTTSLCPLVDFDNTPIYQIGTAPTPDEIEKRRRQYHTPYHIAITEELSRLRQIYSDVILYDCHSIRSQAPFLFTGTLPDFNIGSYDGRSCASSIAQCAEEICLKAEGYTGVHNGRFKGGWTTRHYGQPETGVHALQMELAQNTYMSEHPPFDYNPTKAALLRKTLYALLRTLEELANSSSIKLKSANS